MLDKCDKSASAGLAMEGMRKPVRVDATMYVPVAGCALRSNRPHPSCNPADALLNPDAQSPYFGVVPNYGCLNLVT